MRQGDEFNSITIIEDWGRVYLRLEGKNRHGGWQEFILKKEITESADRLGYKEFCREKS